jgi:hypothetical protein
MIKNITLSDDEGLIEQARRRATSEGTTLNELFRAWLRQYVTEPSAADAYDELMTRLSHVNAGGKFSREEMNDRSWTLKESVAPYSLTPTSSSTRSTKQRRKNVRPRKR